MASPEYSGKTHLAFELEINKNGLLAEWLGTGLQNRLRRFESARDLNKTKNPIDYQNDTIGFFLTEIYLIAQNQD